MNKTVLVVRALIYYAGMILNTALPLPFMLIICIPLNFKWRYRILTKWTMFNMWWLEKTCKLYYRVEGKENIPEGAGIILCKHQSAWETMQLQFIFPPQTWVLKKSLKWIPLFGWTISLLNPVAIDRSSGKRALSSVIEQGTERLKDGIWMVIFPEGTRAAPGTKKRYKIGGAALSVASGFPVVPVAQNSGEFWPRHGFLKQPGTVTVSIGPAIEPEGRTAEEINRLTEEWIENKMAEITTLKPNENTASA